MFLKNVLPQRLVFLGSWESLHFGFHRSMNNKTTSLIYNHPFKFPFAVARGFSSAPWYARRWCSPCCSPCLAPARLDSPRRGRRHGNGCAPCFRAELPWWAHSLSSSWAPAHTQWRPAPLPASTPRSYTGETGREREKGEGVSHSEVSLSVPEGLLSVYIPPYQRLFRPEISL